MSLMIDPDEEFKELKKSYADFARQLEFSVGLDERGVNTVDISTSAQKYMERHPDKAAKLLAHLILESVEVARILNKIGLNEGNK